MRVDGAAASLELFRPGDDFSADERLVGELVAAEIGLVIRAFAVAPAAAATPSARPALELAGDALAAVLDSSATEAEIVRIAAGATGSKAAVVWERDEEATLRVAASYGLDPDAELGAARELAVDALAGPAVARALPAAGLPAGCHVSTTVSLGRRGAGVLQLLDPRGEAPSSERLAALTSFGARVADALQASVRADALALELDRARALLAVVDQTTAELSVAHTLETAVEGIADVLSVSRLAVYLRRPDGVLEAAAARGLSGPHVRVAERLLDVALAPGHGGAVVEVADAQRDPRLADVSTFATDARIVAALAVALRVGDEATGLLAVYPDGRRPAAERDSALLDAFAGQLAVAVQNAQLHEQTTRLGSEREAALRDELDASAGSSRSTRSRVPSPRAFPWPRR